jgi:membrane protein implicated in regulation of membrane protease activity
MPMWIYWVIAGIVLIIAEMTTFTFYLLWLGVGALVAAIVTHFTGDWLSQLLAGCVVAVVLTLLTRPITRNLRHSARGFYDHYEHIVGKTGIVRQAIAPDVAGQVKVGSEVWSASATEPIAVDETVIVLERSSTILKVQKSAVQPTQSS